jgi:hypothetical protein
MNSPTIPEIFKPENFSDFAAPKGVARAAQQIFSQWLETQSVVYGHRKTEFNGWGFDEQGILPNITTHVAYLISPTPIVKEPEKCEHEPQIKLGNEGIRVTWKVPLSNNTEAEVYASIKCSKCGAKLVAKFEVAE